ncbi:hypothetical protein [Bacillus phage vB_BanS-Thrax4]|nr:hypothetical protein [Bacillus phage vB_BanS-Thrax4]
MNITLYTGKLGYLLAKEGKNVWATTTGIVGDYVFTVNKEDARQIKDNLYVVESFESVKWIG